MRKLFQYAAAFRCRFNGWLVSLYLRMLGCKVAGGLRCIRIPTFRDIPKGNIVLGKRVVMGGGVIFEIAESGNLVIGDHVTLGDYDRLSSTGEIVIGDSTLIAENVSIRGSFHQTAQHSEIRKQGSDHDPIHVGRDVLIGAYTLVLQGADIPDGVVIGAHSIVKKSDKLHVHGIFAGFPLKHIRDRT